MALTGTGWPPRRGTVRRRLSNRKWGGARFYTNRAIEAVSRAVPITSRKRWELFGNPNSDHFAGNLLADAVDRGIANSRAGAIAIARACGHPRPENITDYEVWFTKRRIRRGGRLRTFRHQVIYGTHGTGPHLHYGCKRVS